VAQGEGQAKGEQVMKLIGRVVAHAEDNELVSVRVFVRDAEGGFRTLGVHMPPHMAEHWPLGMPITVTVEKGEPGEP